MEIVVLRNTLFISILVCLKLAETTLDPPSYQWPLGNTSVLEEVFRGKDMETEKNRNCFDFPEGHPELPYKSIKIGGKSVSHVEAQLSPDSPFEDMTISILVYPEDTTGETSTLLHYVRGEDNKMKEKIRIRIMDTDFKITFRDRFDIPAGLILIDNPLKPQQWNHLIIVRQFRTGQITVYCNGGKVFYGYDDEFPNNIPIEEDGLFLIGKAYKEENESEEDHEAGEEQFTGRISCLQIFQYAISENDIGKIIDFCKPEAWNYTPFVYLVPDESGGQDSYCVTEYVPTTTFPPFVRDIITVRELTNENVWKSVKQRYGWQGSNRKTSYFKLLSKNQTPTDTVPGIGSVNTTSLSVCSRLCMRIDGCSSFVIHERKDEISRCEFYNFIVENLQDNRGSKYYAIRN